MTLHDAEIDLQTRPDQACFGLYRTAVPFESEFLLIDRRRGQQSRFNPSFEPVRGVWADITDVGCTLAFPSRALCFPIAKGFNTIRNLLANSFLGLFTCFCNFAWLN